MTFQDILEGITRHRANAIGDTNAMELTRKINEIEWALQALAEKLSEHEKQFVQVPPLSQDEANALKQQWEHNEVDDAFEEYKKAP